MLPVVRFDQVSVAAGEKQILRNVTLDVHPGETLMLLGRSGSGKTTLLKTVNRLVPVSNGRVLVNGRNVAQGDVIALRKSIGYAIQNVGLMPHMTVAQNIGLLLRLQGRTDEERVRSLLQLVGLNEGFANRYPRQLSGGEQQRVGIARALANDPPLLLMDEPFGALDPVTRSQLQTEFAGLARRLGKTVLFVTHDLHEALRIGDRIALLSSGRLLSVHPVEQFENATEPEAVAYITAFRDNARHTA